jgi:integrase
LRAPARALTLSEVMPFALYDLRHTRLTPWAKGVDSMMLKKPAGHTSLTTTAQYVHLNDADALQWTAAAQRRHLPNPRPRPLQPSAEFSASLWEA